MPPVPVRPTEKEVSKVYIKNVAKAVANEKKVRFKKVAKKRTTIRKQYTTLKRDTKKRIKLGKKAHYKRENEKIKKMPAVP